MVEYDYWHDKFNHTVPKDKLRRFTEFSANEWAHLTPLVHLFKQFRNDFVQKIYLSQRPQNLDIFLNQNKNLEGQNIAVIIAFEQPWALNFLLEQSKQNLTNTHILVFDNSKNLSLRESIENVCNKNQVAYLALPKNSTRHVNRSHSLAMSWAYHNVIKVLKPNCFTFLDHDLIPLEKINLEDKVQSQPVYGPLIKGTHQYWSLWAGFCTFNFSQVENKNLNFLYDFSRGLDTGGRNWDHIYSHLSLTTINFAIRTYKNLSSPSYPETKNVEVLDDAWIHMSGISYNDNFKGKADFYLGIYDAVKAGARLNNLIAK